MNFLVSAPGKVILFGEHAVVYGKIAVAASLDLRTTLHFTELPEDNKIILIMPKLNLEISIPLEEIIKLVNKSPKLTSENHKEFLEFISEFTESLKYHNSEVQKLGLDALFYLLVAVAQSESLKLKGFKLFLDTKLSIGSGLGSSASFAVCISTCFLHWGNLQKSKVTILDELNLKKISEFSMGCEKIMHGTPSGIDHTVATWGSVIEFKKPDQLFPVLGVKKMEILLVDTKIPRSTKDQVEKFADLKKKFPEVVDSILDAIENLSVKALKIIKDMKSLEDDESQWRDFGSLVEVNHGLLSSCQVSHPLLDKIHWKAKALGLSAKMTGAGGGGYAFIIIPPGTSENVVEEVTKVLGDFLVVRTTLGGPGVKIEESLF